MVDFTRAFMESGKPVFAICHGPQLLLTADQVAGRHMTAWKTVQGDLRKAGADVVDEEVTVDRNLVTSRQPSDIPAFIQKSLELLQRQPAAAGA
jgi:protease I